LAPRDRKETSDQLALKVYRDPSVPRELPDLQGHRAQSDLREYRDLLVHKAQLVRRAFRVPLELRVLPDLKAFKEP
jgi:hypothetical protein